MPRVMQQILPEGYAGDVARPGERGSFGSLSDPFDEGKKFDRRYAIDVSAEFRRAMARRRFFIYWQPDMEMAS